MGAPACWSSAQRSGGGGLDKISAHPIGFPVLKTPLSRKWAVRPAFFFPSNKHHMSSEILSVLEYMEKEKGIPRTDMISTITNAPKTAAQNGANSGQQLTADTNPKRNYVAAWGLIT